MKIEIQDEFFSKEQCKQNPNKLYVFGDNVLRKGKAGQATIRDCVNSFGIVTKVLPSMTLGSFLTDGNSKHLNWIKEDIENLKKEQEHYDRVVFPKAGLGTGLSMMPEKCPELFNALVELLKDLGYNMKGTK